MRCPQCYGAGYFNHEAPNVCPHCKGHGERTPDRIIDGKEYVWEGHYLVDARRYCPHGVFMDWRCNGCDADYGWQGKPQSEREVTR